jgi:hypothetical protein
MVRRREARRNDEKWGGEAKKRDEKWGAKSEGAALRSVHVVSARVCHGGWGVYLCVSSWM